MHLHHASLLPARQLLLSLRPAFPGNARCVVSCLTVLASIAAKHGLALPGRRRSHKATNWLRRGTGPKVAAAVAAEGPGVVSASRTCSLAVPHARVAAHPSSANNAGLSRPLTQSRCCRRCQAQSQPGRRYGPAKAASWLRRRDQVASSCIRCYTTPASCSSSCCSLAQEPARPAHGQCTLCVEPHSQHWLPHRCQARSRSAGADGWSQGNNWLRRRKPGGCRSGCRWTRCCITDLLLARPAVQQQYQRTLVGRYTLTG
jgi:hypothetical protein